MFNNLWKSSLSNRSYELSFLNEKFTINCKKCNGNNCLGLIECEFIKDLNLFNSSFKQVDYYLSDDEKDIYHKILNIKSNIKKSCGYNVETKQNNYDFNIILPTEFENRLWLSSENKLFKIDYCQLCETFIYICEKCNNGSCNGGACNYCHGSFKDFYNTFPSISSFLNEEEQEFLEKIDLLISLILRCSNGKNELDFNEIKRLGYFSKYSEKIFADKLDI